MNIKSRRTAGVLALTALVAGSAGLAGCGTSTVVGTSTGAATGTNTGTGSSSSSDVECPRGIVNDPYPGLCHSYVDSNGNNICDLSEPDDSSASQAALISLSSSSTDDGTSTTGGCPLAPCIVCGICANLG